MNVSKTTPRIRSHGSGFEGFDSSCEVQKTILIKIFYLEDSGCPSSLHFSKWHNRPQGLEAPDDAQCCRLQIWWKYVLKEVHFVICDLDNFFINEGEPDDVTSSVNDDVDVIFKRSVFELDACFR